MRFECKGCGDCCRNFNEKDKCIPLFSWEVEELKKLSKEKNVEIEFKPIKYLLEEKSGIVFVYLYGIKNNVCPFLKENKCTIHNLRPIICRQFPLLWTATQHEGIDFGAHCLSECSCFDCKQEFERHFLGETEASNKEIDFYLRKTYPDCFSSALLSNSLGKKIVEIIGKHDLSGDLKLKEISEKELDKFKQTSFIEFLKFRGFDNDVKELEEIYSGKFPQH